MIVLGIDPGTAVMGFGVVSTDTRGVPSLVECGVLRTSPREALSTRLRLIHEATAELLVRHRPDIVAVEAPFMGKNARSAIILSHARGVILLAIEVAGVAVVEISPALVKKRIVGRGGALKPQVGYMVAQHLRLTRAPSPADAADGVAIALAHILARPSALRLVATA